jgi:hypothetical protein
MVDIIDFFEIFDIFDKTGIALGRKGRGRGAEKGASG